MSFISSCVPLLSTFFRLSFEEGQKAHGPEQRYRSERVGFGVKLLAAGKNPRPPISTDEAETPVIMKTASVSRRLLACPLIPSSARVVPLSCLREVRDDCL